MCGGKHINVKSGQSVINHLQEIGFKAKEGNPQKAIGRVLKPFFLKHVVRPALCLGYLDAMGNKTELETLSSSCNGQVRAILKIILTHFSILASLLPFNKSWSVNRPTPIKTFLLVKGT